MIIRHHFARYFKQYRFHNNKKYHYSSSPSINVNDIKSQFQLSIVENNIAKSNELFNLLKNLNIITEKDFLDYVLHLKKHKRYNKAFNVIQEAEKLFNTLSYELKCQLIGLYLHEGMISRTFDLIESIPLDYLKNNVYFTEMVIRTYCSVGDIEKSLKFFKLKKYPLYSLETLIRACYRYQCIDSLKPFVDEGIEIFINEMKNKNDMLSEPLKEKIFLQLVQGIGLDWDIHSFIESNGIEYTPSLIEKLVYIGSLHNNFDFSIKAFNTGILLGFKPSSYIFNDLLTSASSCRNENDRIYNLLIVYFMMRDHHIRHKTPITNYFKRCFSYSLKIHPMSQNIKYHKINEFIKKNINHISDLEWLQLSSKWIYTLCYTNQINVKLNHTSNNFIEHKRRKPRYEYEHNIYDTEAS